MWITLTLSTALASPDQPFPRATERLVERTYAETRGDGPVYGRFRRRGGPIHATRWGDLVIEHYDRLEGGQVVSTHRFDAAGTLLTTTQYSGGTPARVKLRTDELDVSGWASKTIGGATLLAPANDAAAEGAQRWQGDGWTVVATTFPQAADVFSDDVREALADSCGCLLVDRTTRWLGGRPAAHYRVRRPGAEGAGLGELWAVPSGESVLVLSSTAASEAGLGTGRAIAALLDWK